MILVAAGRKGLSGGRCPCPRRKLSPAAWPQEDWLFEPRERHINHRVSSPTRLEVPQRGAAEGLLRTRNAMTSAIFFNSEAYAVPDTRIMGRNVAGASFLRAFLQYSRTDQFWAHVTRREDAAAFSAAVSSAGRTEPVQIVTSETLPSLAKPGTLFHPGPSLGAHAWRRSAFGHPSWSLCGITHTTCDAGALDSLADLLVAPIQPWDAMICTSRAVKDAVMRMLQAKAEYLKERLGAVRTILPQLPVIPLGIHAQDFSFSDAERRTARRALGVDEKTIVILYAGRLNFHGKAHPLAMYLALQKAVAKMPAGQKALLLQCGWHVSEFSAKAYDEAARYACPSVEVRSLPEKDRRAAWAGADVFCSLSDSIQESFGLTPVEAMAAGLPVIVSDWDGYKDTVRDGIDGIRIPTVMPAAGFGRDLALRHALQIDPYELYCGHSSALVSVDVDAAAAAFTSMFSSPALRARMGSAGKARARDVYDWSVVLRLYEKLWSDLATERAAAKSMGASNSAWPARPDPFHAYAGYPTQQLSTTTKLTLVDADLRTAKERLSALQSLEMVNFASTVLPQSEELEAVLAAAGQPISAGDLARIVAPTRQAIVLRGLVWLLKLNILRIA